MGTKSVCPFARTYIKNWYYSIENQKHLRCVLSTMGITYRRNSVSGATQSYYDMRLPDLLFYCLCRSVVNAHVNILTVTELFFGIISNTELQSLQVERGLEKWDLHGEKTFPRLHRECRVPHSSLSVPCSQYRSRCNGEDN